MGCYGDDIPIPTELEFLSHETKGFQEKNYIRVKKTEFTEIILKKSVAAINELKFSLRW